MGRGKDVIEGDKVVIEMDHPVPLTEENPGFAIKD